MDKSILRRIEELERQQPNSIICLARNMETGEERELPMREWEKYYKEWNFIKVISGNDLNDLDTYLKAIKKYAKEHVYGNNEESI